MLLIKGFLLCVALSQLFLMSLATYSVMDNGDACLLLDIEADIVVTYDSLNGSQTIQRQAIVPVISEEDKVLGECPPESDLPINLPSAQINLTLPDGSTLNVTFVKVQKDNVSYIMLERIVYKYDTLNNEYYINPVYKGEEVITETYNYTLSHSGNYYRCNEYLPIGISGRLYLNMSFVQVQAIDVENNTFSDYGEDCSSGTVAPSSTAKPTTHSTTTHSTSNSTLPPTITTHHTTSKTTSRTTSHKPTTSAKPITTTVAPSPTTYYVTDNSTGVINVCLLMNFSGYFYIPYNRTDKTLYYSYVTFNPHEVVTEGFCFADKQEIALSWRPKTVPITSNPWRVAFTFTILSQSNDQTKQFALTKVDLKYYLDNETFPSSAGSGVRQVESAVDSEKVKATVGKAFHCNANRNITLSGEGLQMVTHDFEVQAFRQSKSTTFDGGEERCTEDTTPGGSPVAPIVVGVVLAILVIVVLVAYFIGRRRARQNNYEQIS